MCTTQQTPRVWLVVGVGRRPDPPDPGDQPTVRDDRHLVWSPDGAGGYVSADGWHHSTWAELRQDTDLVEVTQ